MATTSADFLRLTTRIRPRFPVSSAPTMFGRSFLPALSLLILAILLGSCTAPSRRGIEDLAAIHDPATWMPRSPAFLSVSPDVYLAAKPTINGGPGRYKVDDHRELEQAILKSIATAPREDPGLVIEASSWLAIELLHDDFPAARIQAAAILSSFAGHWIERNQIQLPHADPADADRFARATTAFLAADEAGDEQERLAALEHLITLQPPTPLAAVRTMTGIGRRLGHKPLADESSPRALAFALRNVLYLLEVGSQDSDPDVAENCRKRYNMLAAYALPKTPAS